MFARVCVCVCVCVCVYVTPMATADQLLPEAIVSPDARTIWRVYVCVRVDVCLLALRKSFSQSFLCVGKIWKFVLSPHQQQY